MLKTTTYYLFILGFISVTMSSCSKKDTLNKPANYANVVINNSSILYGNLGLKYQGETIEWNPDGIRVLSGKGIFTVFDTRTGTTLLEQELDISANKPDTLYLFQPDSTIAPQFIRNTQTNEPSAPDGYFKIKIANLSKEALTNTAGERYAKVDIILQAEIIEEGVFLPYDTISAVSTILDTANYYIIKKAVRDDISLTAYKFSFLDHTTKEPILNKIGDLFATNQAFALESYNTKNLYTVYLTDQIRPRAGNGFIFKNDKHYNVIITTLFEN